MNIRNNGKILDDTHNLELNLLLPVFGYKYACVYPALPPKTTNTLLLPLAEITWGDDAPEVQRYSLVVRSLPLYSYPPPLSVSPWPPPGSSEGRKHGHALPSEPRHVDGAR